MLTEYKSDTLVLHCRMVQTQIHSEDLESTEQNPDIIVSIPIFEFHPRLMTESLEFWFRQYPWKEFK